MIWNNQFDEGCFLHDKFEIFSMKIRNVILLGGWRSHIWYDYQISYDDDIIISWFCIICKLWYYFQIWINIFVIFFLSPTYYIIFKFLNDVHRWEDHIMSDFRFKLGVERMIKVNRIRIFKNHSNKLDLFVIIMCLSLTYYSMISSWERHHFWYVKYRFSRRDIEYMMIYINIFHRLFI